MQFIYHKGIVHEQEGYAPFTGALVCGIMCHKKCEGCNCLPMESNNSISQHINAFIREIKTYPKNEGVIFTGLEWTDTYKFLIAMAAAANVAGLKTMLYSGLDEIFEPIKPYVSLFDYIKLGEYDATKRIDNYYQYGVKLSTTNQHILKRGVDY